MPRSASIQETPSVQRPRKQLLKDHNGYNISSLHLILALILWLSSSLRVGLMLHIRRIVVKCKSQYFWEASEWQNLLYCISLITLHVSGRLMLDLLVGNRIRLTDQSLPR
jgi:hypothetical protein